MQFDVRQVTSGIAARGAHLTRQMTVNREVDVVASKQVLSDRAASLLALHQPGNPVVLPTVWDAWSEEAGADAGFAALTVGTHPVADSVGGGGGGGEAGDEVLTPAARVT